MYFYHFFHIYSFICIAFMRLTEWARAHQGPPVEPPLVNRVTGSGDKCKKPVITL